MIRSSVRPRGLPCMTPLAPRIAAIATPAILASSPLIATITACGPADPASSSASASESDGASSSSSSSSSASTTTSSSATGTASDGSTTGDGSSSGDATTGETGDVGSPGCGLPSAGPGKYPGRTLDVGGVVRSYDLLVPAGHDQAVPAPLVLNFHGLLGNPAQQADLSNFDAIGDARGMLVAYPAGIGNSFNTGACCGDAQAMDVDDVGFARALVEEISRVYCVDPRRVYATGMSNGGHMAHLLACVAADVFAAAASVTGVLQLPPAECAPARPISILDFHGTGDLIVRYDGSGPGYPPVLEMMQGWAARDGCDPASAVVFDQGDMRCETWPNCRAAVEVTLCTIDGGGHCWPGSGDCLFGANSSERDASAVIADMFEAQPMP